MRVLFFLLLVSGLWLGCHAPSGTLRPVADAGDLRDGSASVHAGASAVAGEAACEADEDPLPPVPCTLPVAARATKSAGALLAALLSRASERNEAGQELRRSTPVQLHMAGRGTAFLGPAPTSTMNSSQSMIADRAAERGDPALPFFREALSCANTALRVQPTSLPVLRQRAIAQRELGSPEEARDTLTRALALVPDDPETLALAADLYISHLSATREHSEIGLLYAEQGRKRLSPKATATPGKTNSRRRRAAVASREPVLSDATRALLARLWLLSGQALLDLGRASEALPALDSSLRLAELSEARYERAVALFELVRLPEAEMAFSELLAKSPQPPNRQTAFVHYHLGLIFDQRGRTDDAERELKAARDLLPEQFPEPLSVSMAEFQALVRTETDALTPEHAADLKRVRLEIADLPDPADLTLETPPLSPTILGLFRGLPLGEEPSEPRSIVLYRKNLLRAVRSNAELVREIRKTLLHELGHLHGADEDDLREEGLE